jgi:hypothetical protein
MSIQNILAAVQIAQRNGGFKSRDFFVSAITPTGKPKGENKHGIILNAIPQELGYDIALTTLTAIRQGVIEQKFFTLDITNYVPLRVGFGAWKESILAFRSYSDAEDFESGYIDTATNARIAEVDGGIDSVTSKIKTWAKSIGYSLADINFANVNGNWSLIETKEKARKKNWDLGIQKTVFLGSSDPDVEGLLTQRNSGITIDTTTFTSSIADMTPAEIQKFIGLFIAVYFKNSNYTIMPNRLLLPITDWFALGQAVSPDFPINSRRQYIMDEFKKATMDPNAEILPNVYADPTISGLGVNRAVLYRLDPENLEMNIPVNYTSTIAGTTNGFQFHDVSYGQHTGVTVYRPQSIMYFDYKAPTPEESSAALKTVTSSLL